jgi:putative (di)nucleoside polyphosphate hydrolase
MSLVDHLPYRPCVGITLFNTSGQVFVGERIDTPGSWQMPQGGIDPGEDIETAFYREMREEIGTDKATILKTLNEPLRYDLPPPLQQKLWGGQFRGQEQIWVAGRFTGQDVDIRIDAHHPPEFSRWKWVSFDEILDMIVPFKRDIYRAVIAEFKILAPK